MNRIVEVAAGCAVALLVAGCGSAAMPAAGPPAPVTTAQPSDPYRWPTAAARIDAGLRHDIVRAVDAHQSAFDAMLADPVSAAAVAAATRTSTATERAFVTSTATSMVRDGLVGRGHFRARWVVLAATRQHATVGGCGRPDQVRIYHRRSGRPAENPNPGVAVLVYGLRAESNGRWSVSDVTPRTADRCPDVLPPAR